MSDKGETDMTAEPEAAEPEAAQAEAEAFEEAPEPEAPQQPDAPEPEPEAPAPQPSPEDIIADLEDKWRRALAEVHNVRRRAEEEHRNALRYGIREFARDMLSVCDNLERALEAAGRPAGEAQPQAQAGGELLAGIQAIRRQLLDTMERHGIRQMQPLGERFDPNYHEAVFEAQQDGERDFDVVATVVQPGYMIGERLLRPARVGVARAGAGAGPAAGNGNGGAPGA